MSSDNDAIDVIRGQLCVVLGVLMARHGLDEASACALIAEEWTARDLPLAEVARQLLEEAVDGRG